MKRNWIQAGFVVISNSTATNRESRLLPPRIVTVSTCIVESYPDVWALPWAATPPETLSHIRELLTLDERTFAEMLSWVNRAIDLESLGWPNVFFSPEAALEFRRRFLGAVSEARTIALSLEKDVAEVFLREEAPQEGRGGSGIWTMLSRMLPVTHRLVPLGFEVLGADWGGAFHTFSCNGLERQFSENLGIAFNQDGLIDAYEDALKASEYTNRDDVGAEPVAWYPFRLDEYRTDLESAGP